MTIDQAIPEIDPNTGKPIEPPKDDPMKALSTELESIKAKLDSFDKQGISNQPIAPQTPTGPTIDDQIGEIDKQIAALGDQIDLALSELKPVKGLLAEQGKLTRKLTDLQIQKSVSPQIQAGLDVLNNLSDQVVQPQMKHLQLVRQDYDALMKTVDPSQRANPEVKRTVYEAAVGKNLDKILAAQKEEILRDAASTPQVPDATSRKPTDKDGNEIPAFKDVMPPGALVALREKGQTPDKYYESRGYPGGWSEYYEKHKDYFEGGLDD